MNRDSTIPLAPPLIPPTKCGGRGITTLFQFNRENHGMKDDACEPRVRARVHELKLVRDFLQWLGATDKAQGLTYHDRPDFYVTVKGVAIDIEITEYHSDRAKKGSRGRVDYEMWREISEKLRAALHAVGLPNISGSIFFHDQWHGKLRKIAYEDQAKLVSEIVSACRKLPSDWRCQDFSDLDVFPTLSRFADHLHIDVHSQDAEGALWGCSHLKSGKVENPNVALQKIVDDKCASGAGYEWRKGADKWLVIVASAFSLCATARWEASIDISFNGDQTIFDRIYFWDRFSGSVWQIWPSVKIAVELRNGEALVHRGALPRCFV
jgi:hypothetical protein